MRSYSFGLWPFFPSAIPEDCGTAARQEYLREFDQFFGAYRKGCADLGLDYKVMNTNSNLELALSEYLYQRSRLY